ncbi:MAG: heme ABC transporter ATP-binding protein [Pseudomonadota bacterium]
MLEAQGLSMRLGGRLVLEDVSLALSPGEVVAVIGPNGAGKSTLLGCLSGALRPADGSVTIDGDHPAALTPAALGQRRAVLEQTPEARAPFGLDELVGLAIPRAVSPKDADTIVARAIAALGLDALAKRAITELSGGERHRAHMARALAQLWAGRLLGAGRWLLLDEPTASLDLAHQDAVLRAARQVAREGAGVLAVLHDLTLAAAVADRIALMERGRLVALGTPEAVLTPERLGAVYALPVAVSAPVPGALAVTPLFSTAHRPGHSQGASPCSSP